MKKEFMKANFKLDKNELTRDKENNDDDLQTKILQPIQKYSNAIFGIKPNQVVVMKTCNNNEFTGKFLSFAVKSTRKYKSCYNA